MRVFKKLPFEIEELILRYAGPLSQFLARPKSVDTKCRETVRSLWQDALKYNWQGELHSLPSHFLPTGDPDYELQIVLSLNDFALVSNRGMYLKLCSHLPHRRIDLLHIPMRHCWTDLLSDYPATDAMWLFTKAVMFGYTQLVEYLMASNALESFAVVQCRFLTWEQTEDEFIASLNDDVYSADTMRSINCAAMNGHIEVIKLLHNVPECASEAAIDEAAYMGYFDIIKWLHQNRNEGCSRKAMDNAAITGHLSIMIWLNATYGVMCTRWGIECARENEHQHVVDWIIQNNMVAPNAETDDFVTYRAM